MGWLQFGLKFSFTLFYKKKFPTVLVEEQHGSTQVISFIVMVKMVASRHGFKQESKFLSMFWLCSRSVSKWNSFFLWSLQFVSGLCHKIIIKHIIW